MTRCSASAPTLAPAPSPTLASPPARTVSNLLLQLALNLLDDPVLASAFSVSLRTSFNQVPHAVQDPVGESTQAWACIGLATHCLCACFICSRCSRCFSRGARS